MTSASKYANPGSRQGKPYEFTHYIFLSRAYHLTARGEEMVPSPRNTKRYKAGGSSESERNKDGVYGFHLEDEEIIKVCFVPSVVRLPVDLIVGSGRIARVDIQLCERGATRRGECGSGRFRASYAGACRSPRGPRARHDAEFFHAWLMLSAVVVDPNVARYYVIGQ